MRRRTVADDKLESLIRTLVTKYPQYYIDTATFVDRHIDFFCRRRHERYKDNFKHPAVLNNLALIHEHVEGLSADDWNVDTLRDLSSSLTTLLEGQVWSTDVTKKPGQCLQFYLRWVFVGGRSGPSLPDTMVLLGREECLSRLKSAEEEMSKKGLAEDDDEDDEERLFQERIESKHRASESRCFLSGILIFITRSSLRL